MQSSVLVASRINLNSTADTIGKIRKLTHFRTRNPKHVAVYHDMFKAEWGD